MTGKTTPEAIELLVRALRTQVPPAEQRLAAEIVAARGVPEFRIHEGYWSANVWESTKRRFTVHLDFLSADSIDGECSCPRGRLGFCAHMLALALELARQPTPPKVTTLDAFVAGQAGTPAAELLAFAQAPELTVPIRQDRVIEWAARHHVASRLTLYLERAQGLLAKAPRMASPYESVLRALTVTPHSPSLQTLPRVVAEWLVAESERVAENRAVRQARISALAMPPEAVLEVPWTAAVQALLDLEVLPTFGSTMKRDGELAAEVTMVDSPLRLLASASTACGMCGYWGGERALVVALEAPYSVNVCSSNRGMSTTGCPLAETTLRAVLDVLKADSTSLLRPKVLATLAIPAWRRALEAMPPPEEAPSNYAVVVTPGPRGGITKLHLATTTPKKRGGVTLKRCQETPLGAPGHVLRWLWFLPDRASTESPRFISALLAQSVGRTDLYIAGSDQPCTVVSASVQLTTRKAKIGDRFGLGFGYEFDGEVSPLGELGILVRENMTHLARVHADDNRMVIGEIPDSLREMVARSHAQLGLVVPKEGTAELVRHLVRTGVPVSLPKAVAGKPLAVSATPVLRATWSRPTLTLQFGLHYHDDYPVLLAGEGPPTLYVDDDGDVRHIDRDLTRELELSNAVAAALGVDLIALSSSLGALVPSSELARAFETMKSLGAGEAPDLPKLRIDWTTVAPNVLIARPAQVKVMVSSGRDWFGLEGGLDLGGKQVPLGLLLKAIRERHTYIELGTDDIVVLSESLTDALAPMAGVAQPRAGKKGNEEWRLTRLGAASLGDVQDAGMFVEGPDDWANLLERVQEAATLEIPLPPDLRADLRHYQLDGFQWLARLAHWSPGACLCDDMGLGKTVQAIALLLHRVDAGPALVVAPTSVGFNWVRELERFAPSLRPRLFRGATTKQLLEGLRSGDVLITNYELLASYAPDFLGREWGTLVLDEAQAVKNATTLRARAATELRAKFRVALTGTPIENRTDELWSLFNATVPGLFGSFDTFRERFGQATERRSGAHQARVLSRIIRPFILRRLKREVARELPARTDINIEVDLSPAERKLYEQIRRSVVDTLTRGSDAPPQQIRFQVLTALTRLRQAACHPRLLDPRSTVPSSKLEALLQIVDDLRAEGHRALIFSQFTTHLGLVREALDARSVSYRYLDGSTPAASRRVEVDAFQAGEGDVFLLSLKAGGTGLNLTGADYVIHLDPWWNPAVEDQATDRAHRIGQTRAVTVYRIVARDTLEDRILALHADKRELMTTVLDGTSDAGPMSTDELMDLMSAGLTDTVDDLDDNTVATGRQEPITAGALPPGPAKASEMEVVDGPPAPKRRGRPPKKRD